MQSKCVTLVHPAPNPNVRNVALALYEADLLCSVVSTIAYLSKGKLSRFLKMLPHVIRNSIENQLSRRTWSLPVEVSIVTHSSKEIMRLIFLLIGLDKVTAIKNRLLIDWVSCDLDKYVAQKHLANIN